MKLKPFFLFGLVFFLLVLTGCAGNIPYDPNLFKANSENCWPCAMYEEAFVAIERTLDGCLVQVAQNAIFILKICLAFWLAIRVGKLVISLEPPNLKKEVSDFAVMGFKVLMVSIILNNPNYFYEIFGEIILQPIGKGFIEMSGIVLKAPSDLGVETTAHELLSGFLGGDSAELLRSWKELFGRSGEGEASSEIMEKSKMFGGLGMQIQYIIFQIYDALWRGIGLGFQLLVLADFSAFFAALLLIGGMFWLLLRIPLAFIDAFLRIGLVMLLMPVLLVGWIFSYPPGIVKKVFNIFFAGFFDILFTCIYIAFLVSLFRVYESRELPYLFSSSYQTTEGGMRTNSANFSTDFLILALLTWCMLFLSKKVQDFSGFFFEGIEKSSISGLIDKGISYAWKATKIGFHVVTGNFAAAGVEAAKTTKEVSEDITDQKSDKSEQSPDKKESAEKPKDKGDK